MILNRISILNYKNIAQTDLTFSSKLNCFFGQNGNNVTPTFACGTQTDNGVSISINGTSMLVTVADFTSPAVLSYPITVDDGETTFTQRFGVAVVGGTTGIYEGREKREEARGGVFNLYGQRLSQPQKGVNIQNGRKIMVR